MAAQGLNAGRDNILAIVQASLGATAMPAERLPVFEVPLADRRWFWGRQDLLDELEKAWRENATVALTQTLAGMGGVGKSQLAAQFAYRRRNELDVVWWVSCTPAPGGELDAHALARARLAALAPHLGLALGEDAEATAASVRRWLETTTRRWLVVFDDAPEWAAVRSLVPQGGHGLCLITSRNHHWDLADAVVDVGTFDPETAAAFLQARAGLDDPGGARALAEALGGLALALEQAGAFLARSPVPMGFTGYLDALRQRGLQVFAGKRVEDYDHLVTTVWEQSFEAVSSRHPGAAELLELFAVLAPAPVPSSLLSAGPGEDFDVAAALGALADYSLVSSASGAVVVHQLVRAALAERMDDASTAAAHARAVKRVKVAFPDQPSDPRTWAAATALIPHVLALFSALRDDADLLAVASRVGHCLWAQGDFGASGHVHADVLAAYREILGERHPNTLISANNLATALRNAGELDRARRLHEQVLAAQRETLGERHPDTLISANNLAATLWAQGDLEGAARLHEEVLAARRETLGQRHPDTLMSADNLAVTVGALGQKDRARRLHEEVLASRREILGERHPDTLISANNLAAAMWSQGELDGARRLHEEVLAARREILGERHPDTLMSLGNLATTLRDQGELERACELYGRLVAAYRETLGEDHPQTLTVALRLAEVTDALAAAGGG